MKIVFFGDSITDCNRDRNDIKSLGDGYVKFLAGKLRPLYPDADIQLINMGKSGDEVGDLLARVDSDVIALRPDAVVIMIGINNTIHQFKIGKQLDFAQFGKDLEELIGKLKAAGIVVIFLEPFLLPAPEVMKMRKLFDEELEIINEVCLKMCDEFVAYDEMFNGLAISFPYTDYSLDGIHPTLNGSLMIADTAIKAIRKHLL